jgi:hypothetical protein
MQFKRSTGMEDTSAARLIKQPLLARPRHLQSDCHATIS